MTADTPDVAVIEQLTELATVVAVLALVGFLVVFGAMLLRASRYPWPTPIIAPIAMLTLIFGVSGLVNAELVPLAGAGLGALAGVLTAQLGKPRPRADAPGTGLDREPQLEDDDPPAS